MKKGTLIQLIALVAFCAGLCAQEDPAPAPAEPAPAEPAPAAPAPAEPAPAEPAPAEPAPAEAAPAEAAPADPAKLVTPPVPPVPPAPKVQAAPEDVAAPPEGAEKTESGISSRVLQEGTGTSHPKADEKVRVHYSGWQTDGYNFDSSYSRGVPSTFGLNGVIAGWTEGVQLMVEGEKRRFWIPGDLAYGKLEGELPPIGENGKRPGQPLGQLCFDIELIKILRPHPTPENLTAAPEDAPANPSGVASKVIKAGAGESKPKPTDNVQVHYTVWTTDGKVVDSTLPNERPKTLPLKRTIKGFTEGVQMMVEGETRRIWVPTDMAYGAAPPPTAPEGMLVFEVELLKILSN